MACLLNEYPLDVIVKGKTHITEYMDMARGKERAR